MEPAAAPSRHEATDHDDRLAHRWRMARLTGLGVPGRLPKRPPTTSAGTRSPRWRAAAARHGSRCASSAEAAPWPATSPPGTHPVTVIRGRLRMYLGYAPGAGAACVLLHQGQRRRFPAGQIPAKSVPVTERRSGMRSTGC
jgi:hypothetical protein